MDTIFDERDSRNLGKVVMHPPARDPHGHRRLPRRNDDPHARVAAAAHGAPSRVHHEANQEPEGAGKRKGDKRSADQKKGG